MSNKYKRLVSSIGEIEFELMGITDFEALKSVRTVYVINNTANVAGIAAPVFFNITHEDGSVDTAQVPVSWMPFNLTEIASKESILRSRVFRDCLNKKLLLLVVPDSVTKFLEKVPSGAVEMTRAKNSVFQASPVPTIQDTKKIEGVSLDDAMLKGLTANPEMEESAKDAEGVNPQVIGLVLSNASANDIKASLDYMDHTKFTKQDIDYIIRHTSDDGLHKMLDLIAHENGLK